MSLSGRVTLCKSFLGSIPLYFMSLYRAPTNVIDAIEKMRRKFIWGVSEQGKSKISWVAWQKTIAPRNLGGLGIGSLKLANTSLLAKWWWRWKLEKNSLWVNVIKALHKISVSPTSSAVKARFSGVWSNIFKSGTSLLSFNLNIEDLFSRSNGNGQQTLFWLDRWIRGVPLKLRFPDLFEQDSHKECSVANRVSQNSTGGLTWNWSWLGDIDLERLANLEELLQSVSVSQSEDSWKWEGDPSGVFSVKSLRIIIENVSNSPFAGTLFWNKWIPPRVNCFVWRLLLNRIPTKLNLIVRGINLPSDSCPLCNSERETEVHLFYLCPVFLEIWKWVSNWCGIKVGHFNSLEQLYFNVLDGGGSPRKQRFLEVVVGTVFWLICKSRNDAVFNRKFFSASLAVSELQVVLFTWFKYRAKWKVLDWSLWCCNRISLL